MVALQKILFLWIVLFLLSAEVSLCFKSRSWFHQLQNVNAHRQKSMHVSVSQLQQKSTDIMCDKNLNGKLSAEIKNHLDEVIRSDKVVLFMKGNRLYPSCGFSNRACRILEALNVEFETINVLDDDSIREGIKLYSNWPTIPQLYVNGEFIGGSDIMLDLFNSGELAKLICVE